MSGRRSKSRLDPLAISADITVYVADSELGWTSSQAAAATQRGKPQEIPAKKKGDKPGRPSLLNHSNVTPELVEDAGGVTLDFAEQTTVLSFGSLRKLRFPIDGERNPSIDDAARCVLASLGLVATAALRKAGCDLRSRCVLVPETAGSWELLDGAGSPAEAIDVDLDASLELFDAAVKAARDAGLPWAADELVLTPSPELCALVTESRRREADKPAFVPAGDDK